MSPSSSPSGVPVLGTVGSVLCSLAKREVFGTAGADWKEEGEKLVVQAASGCFVPDVDFVGKKRLDIF